MSKKSPLAQVKEQFGSKDKLVDALLGLPESVLERGEEEKDAFRGRLLAAANRKLLRLYEVGQAVEKRFGGKNQLVDGLLKLANRSKDADYRGKLQTLSLRTRGGAGLVAVDALGAGPGEWVLVAHGSRVRDLTVGAAVADKDIVVAIVDGWEEPG